VTPDAPVRKRPGWRRVAGWAKRSVRRLLPGNEPTIEKYLDKELPHLPLLRSLFPGGSAHSVLDIGACEGEDSIRYCRMFPNARIFACEALPTNVALLTANLVRFEADRVTVVPQAISDRIGTATFHVSSGRPDNVKDGGWDYGNKSSSLLRPDKTEVVHQWLKFDEAIEVPTLTISDLMAEHGLDQVDFVHMDIQGAELMALRGAGDRITDIKSIWLEVEAVPLYEDQPLRDDIESFMSASGFRKVIDTVDDVAGDQFYVNDRFFGPDSGWRQA